MMAKCKILTKIKQALNVNAGFKMKKEINKLKYVLFRYFLFTLNEAGAAFWLD